MKKNDNNLFYTCSLIELIGRTARQKRKDVVNLMGEKIIRHIYHHADTLHCEPIAKIADYYIDFCHIPTGEFDNIASCKYTVPSYWDIGKVYARLIEDIQKDDVIFALIQVYNSTVSDSISYYNSDFFYQPRGFIKEQFLSEGNAVGEKTLKKPAIRFRGFTDAWEQRKLGEICNSFAYGLNAAAKPYDGKNKYIRITDIADETRIFSQEDLTSPDIDLNKAEQYKLQHGDIVFARTGASVGKTYLFDTQDGTVYYAGFLIRAKVNKGNSADFIFQATLSEQYRRFITITSQRSGQPGVNAQEYSEWRLYIPHGQSEQHKIGAFFRNLDRLITLHQRKYDKLSKIKKSMLEKLFPKNGSNVPEIRFAGFTDAWEQRKIKEIFKVTRGYVLAATKTTSRKDNENL